MEKVHLVVVAVTAVVVASVMRRPERACIREQVAGRVVVVVVVGLRWFDDKVYTLARIQMGRDYDNKGRGERETHPFCCCVCVPGTCGTAETESSKSRRENLGY